MAEEMRSIKKAVGFTGKTIKRWLATGSPKPNAQQTKDVEPVIDNPATPVRSGKSNQRRRSRQGTPAAPRRKASKVVELSRSTPSIPIEEPQTPSGCPKLPSESSIENNDNTISTSPTKADSVDIPTIFIKDPAIVTLIIKHSDELVIYRTHISLEATPSDLNPLLAQGCARWRHEHTDYMRLLKSRNQGVHMAAHINFGDHRDFYVSGDTNGLNRFPKLRDFFEEEEINFRQEFADEPPIIPFQITVDNIDLDSIVPPPPKQPLPAHHRVAAWPTAPQSPNSPHEPLETGLYGAYNPTTGHMHPSLLKIPQRPINSTLIGSFSAATLHTGRIPYTTSCFEPHYQNLGGMSNTALPRMIQRRVYHNVQSQIPEGKIPWLPPMTFNEISQNLDTDGISNKPIYLAVRLVNGLPDLQGGRILLPQNLLMTAHQGRGMSRAIREALITNLYHFSTKFGQGLGIERLFTESGVWEGHRVDFWVLPQKGERLHLFERGSLKWFLDPGMAGEGERKLYVEAWILPDRGDDDGDGEEGEDGGGGIWKWEVETGSDDE